MNPGSPHPSGSQKSFLVIVAIFVSLLGLLFFKAFTPGHVVFSNDGPLGQMVATQNRMPAILTGLWVDLNWLGSVSPSPSPNVTSTLRLITSPLTFAKLFAPFSLLFVGLSAWFCFRQFKFSPVACVLGGLAATLNGDFFGTACWGVCSQPIAFGLNFLALAALADTASPRGWMRVVLAGFAVGMGVVEAYDIGALFSLFVAAFVVYQAFMEAGAPARRVATGLGRLAIVAVFAGFIAASTVGTLIGTQIKGVAGAEEESQAGRWSWATQWSLPKSEALGIVVPGLFGFRMDTPDGGAYWGAAGRDLAWDEYLAGDRKGPVPMGFMRYGGGGGYAGQLVLVLAVWAVVQSFRRQDSVFSLAQRRMIWFWLAVMGVALLLMFGRFAPFYQFFFALPYAATIRNPAKFLHIFEWALLIVFAYGAHGLWQRYVVSAPATGRGLVAQWQAWWARPMGFEKRWVIGSLVCLGVVLLGWFAYAKGRGHLEDYLTEIHVLEATQQAQQGGPAPDPAAAAMRAQAQVSFSLGQVGRFILLLAPSLGLVALVLCGYFAGARARVAAVLFGLVLVADLAPANRPWVVIFNWREKYVEAGNNPVIQFLRQKPYEQRVSIADAFLPPQFGMVAQVYRIEWMQHLFQYYNIQSPDIIQMPRTPVEVEAFERAMFWDRRTRESAMKNVYRVLRRWELMSTRYLLAGAGMAEALNRELDPQQKRFREIMAFDFYSTREGGPILTRTNAGGQFALMEFTGALPKARLYGNWQVQTNDAAALERLASRDFEPAQTVLVADAIAPATATNLNPGTVEFASYAPKHLVLRARAEAPAVLLLNDKFDPNWRVTVDGKPAPLLRCNYVMRGVQLSAGEHVVEFRFAPPLGSLYVSLAAVGMALLLLGYLVVAGRREPSP